VIVAGRAIDTTLPDYRELDHLYASEPAERFPCPPMTSTA
jgi:hypothetical protein